MTLGAAPWWVLAAAAVLGLPACGAGESGALETDLAPSFAELEGDVFGKRCAFSACHGEVAPRQGMSLMPGSAYDNIVNQPSTEAPELLRVKPGDPEGSYLFQKLSLPTPARGERMPPGQPLEPEVLAAVRSWIAAGAAAEP